MIQIRDNLYINKNQILHIKEEYDSYKITMTDGNHYYIYSSSYEYYQKIRDFLEGNNE